MRRAAAALLLALLASAPALAGETVRLWRGDAGRFGHPYDTPEPRYPDSFVAAQEAGFVTLTTGVDAWGSPLDPVLEPGSPAMAPMLEPLRQAVRRWTFVVPLGIDCAPSAERVATRVHFEFDGLGPRMRVDPLAGKAAGSTPAEFLPAKREAPRYPAPMVRAGRGAIVYLLAEIAPSGDVSSLALHAYSRSEGPLDAFKAAVTLAMAKTKFPEEPASAPPRAVCQCVQFNVR